jgi:hypothetical protein
LASARNASTGNLDGIASSILGVDEFDAACFVDGTEFQARAQLRRRERANPAIPNTIFTVAQLLCLAAALCSAIVQPPEGLSSSIHPALRPGSSRVAK